MTDTALELIEQQIGFPPGVQLATAFAANQRAALESWLQLKGISARASRNANLESLIKAYANDSYLRSWRDSDLRKQGVRGPKPAISWDSDDRDNSNGEAATSSKPTTVAIANATEAVIGTRLTALQRELEAALDSKLRDAKLVLTDKAKDEIRTLAREAAEQHARDTAPPRRLEIVSQATGQVHDLGLQHERFPSLLRAMQARGHRGQRLNIWLTGPTGSGKTSACESAAKALDLDFGADSSLDTDYKVTGFVDAHGQVVSTQFIKCYTSASAYVADEIDNWLPSALIALNAALANGWMATPAGLVQRHPDAVIIACANTWGLGATNDYVGRSKLDAASLDRFRPKIDWPYDEKLEAAIAAELAGQEWCAHVQHARAAARRQGLQVIISPRATYDGIGLLAAGFSWQETEEMALTAGLKPEQIKALALAAEPPTLRLRSMLNASLDNAAD
jgi:cobaltochelatase CobS